MEDGFFSRSLMMLVSTWNIFYVSMAHLIVRLTGKYVSLCNLICALPFHTISQTTLIVFVRVIAAADEARGTTTGILVFDKYSWLPPVLHPCMRF